MIFPLRQHPTADYHEAPRSFGSPRPGRKHAACDLYAPKGTEILAVADGVITHVSTTYYHPSPEADWVGAVEVWHGMSVGKIRYAEIDHLAAGLQAGSPIKAGQVIAYVGQVAGMTNAMLHFEKYSGNLNGPLTVIPNKPFERRKDLQDPTGFLDSCTLLQS